ncbi:VOC family protein [Rhodanobacter sp. AS-Z3]|uniref:VOC family protein n=1 Tax=Rhodanobacter sp. AS-Z3 TaxID=3031330 RepID=UPI00247B07FA|nr:VOC family protein [Rhodanobacter sp. AS-Z3]WEN14125.1 VOC family protein [Rhodanobacter sp. AS-Z3]
MHLQFERFTIFCRDLQASLAFYRDVLGLIVVEEKLLEGAAAGALLQLPPCRMQIALLAAAVDAPVIVGLFQISDTPMATLQPPLVQPACSQTALVLSTSNFDGLHNALSAAGSRFLTPPVRYPKRQASERSPAGVYREMIVYDPDNIPVSILQVEPFAEAGAN